MLLPMLASLLDAPLVDPRLVYEPKYDGIRAIAEVQPARKPLKADVHLWSRLGNDKTSQFRDVADALATWSRTLKAPVTLDGEVVALDANGNPTGFQHLQGRIHLTGTTRGDAGGGASSAAFIAFDLLRDGSDDLRDRPLTERRARLEQLFKRTGSPLLRLSEQVRGDGRELYRRAISSGWEGLIAKDAASRYRSGRRTPDWRKLKILHEQEFVVGGWTEPRQSRSHFGALLLGVHERGGGLTYVGHTGTGFDERELARVYKALKPLETSKCPFHPTPPTNERPHWVEPKLVAQVKFTEWTNDGHLRHPVYLGLRDDKRPRDIVREKEVRIIPRKDVGPRKGEESRKGQDVLDQLRALEDARKDGVLELPGGQRLAVTNLHKVFWPQQKLTKGDLFRYYVQVAPFILPVVADRPLVMKRYPNGVSGKPFYQHRADAVPPGVRQQVVEVVERRPQLIGGDLTTLLYMTQLAAISQDPWFSRVQTIDHADYVALDLDPPPDMPFARVIDVARWIHDELESAGVAGFPKTSGATGLHVYVPLPPSTPYDVGMLFCQIVAAVVAQKHPKLATTERSVAARGKRVYVDALQNVLGKTLATAYSARASEYAGVSTPLTWKELERPVRREDFTITSLPARLHDVGDLWAGLRASRGISHARIARYAESANGPRKRR